MLRSNETEILDEPGLPDELLARAYHDMAGIHRWLGDVRFMIREIRRDPLPVRRILDVGCGTGLIAQQIGRALGVDVIGADIRPGLNISAAVPIVRVDACREPLPGADVAFCMLLCHHLSSADVIQLIRNVGRYCRRLIILDLVRHPLPLALFRLFVAPLICEVDARDGACSIRRSYTPTELHELTGAALEGSDARFRSSVTLFRLRQIVDISYGGLATDDRCLAPIAEEDECLR